MLNRRCRGGRRHKLRLGRRKGGQGGGSMPPGGGDNIHPTEEYSVLSMDAHSVLPGLLV